MFLNRFWNFAKQEVLRQEIMGGNSFNKSGKDLLTHVNEIKYKNDFLTKPFQR